MNTYKVTMRISGLYLENFFDEKIVVKIIKAKNYSEADGKACRELFNETGMRSYFEEVEKIADALS